MKLVGYGEATAYGAATIVNAIATGKGAAFGIDLWTAAKVRLTDEPGVVAGKIANEPSESTLLIEKVVEVVFKHYKVHDKYGAVVETVSNIPIARGLKSSSVAANALVLASAAALQQRIDDVDAVNLGVDAAVEAKTTITGAYDDACASYFGNIVVTDNLQRKILKRGKIAEEYRVLIHIPPEKAYTATSDVRSMKLIAPQVEVAFQEALTGNYWTALTLNGMLYSAVLGYNQKPAVEALKAGAVAAGLSGKGPATVAVTEVDKVDSIIDAWGSYEGHVITTKVNRRKAHMSRKV